MIFLIFRLHNALQKRHEFRINLFFHKAFMKIQFISCELSDQTQKHFATARLSKCFCCWKNFTSSSVWFIKMEFQTSDGGYLEQKSPLSIEITCELNSSSSSLFLHFTIFHLFSHCDSNINVTSRLSIHKQFLYQFFTDCAIGETWNLPPYRFSISL